MSEESLEHVIDPNLQASRWSARLRLLAVLVGNLVLIASRHVLPVEIVTLLLVVWNVLVGHRCELNSLLAVISISVVCDATLSANLRTYDFGNQLVCWSLTIGLMCWVTLQQRNLQIEHRRARLDSLTGLANRQAFFERYDAEQSRANRFQRPLTVMLLDGDNFKLINDRYGHLHGDQALALTAHTLRQRIRPYDLACRFGGDEFALIFPETKAEDAERIGERLRNSLQDALSQSFSGLTFSVGIVTLVTPISLTAVECLAESDRCLYEAKSAGKATARFRVFSSAMTPRPE